LQSEDIATCVEDNLLTTPEAWRWWLEDGSRENIASDVGHINCPVLVMVGSEDPVIPPGVIRTEVLPRMELAKYIEIAGAGHLLPLEAPEEISHAIEAFAERQ
jgi:pimeloyl-ACP methyl ester carboxylesterase